MGHNKRYSEEASADPRPHLQEDERIYFSVPYMAKGFARVSHCGFDTEKKLWFTGLSNRNLIALVELYKVNEATSDKMKQLLRDKMDNE